MRLEVLKKLTGEVPQCKDRDYKRQLVPKGLKKTILERDGSECQICGYNKRLYVHHIKPDGESSKENLITLCSSCHQFVHVILHREKGYKHVPKPWIFE